MKKLSFFLVSLTLLCTGALAQDAYFINDARHKTIAVKIGHTVSITYRGYLGQKDFVKAQVTDINDSMITLGNDPALFPGFMRRAMENSPTHIFRRIYLKDIMTFRRMTPGRQLLKSGLMLANVAGSFYFYRYLAGMNKFSASELFWISLGTGIGSSILINMMLPETPKYRMVDGWRIVVADEPPATRVVAR